MRTICLSDHVGNQIRRFEVGRLQSQDYLRKEYAKAKARKKAALWRAAANIFRSGAAFRIVKLVESIEDLRDALHAPLPFRATRLRKGEQESAWISGQEGEERVLRKLRKLCSNPCTALLGYNGPKGEIDIVLVGRYGVTAIEIKNYAGNICCDGNLWWRPRSGGTEGIHDAAGRSPSVQVTECANELQAALYSNSLRIPVRRIVVLAHPRAEYGDPFRPAVDWACKAENLNRRLLFDCKLEEPLDRDRIACVCDIIAKQHNLEVLRRAARRDADHQSPLFEATYSNVERKSWGLSSLPRAALLAGGVILLAIIGFASVGSLLSHGTKPCIKVSTQGQWAPAQNANRKRSGHAKAHRDEHVIRKSHDQTANVTTP